MRLRLFAITLAVLCLAALPASADSTQQVTLSLDQARDMGRAALTRKQPKLAFTISEGLLQADPNDGHALFIRAYALGQMRDYDLGRKTAARAYRVADNGLQRYESAKLAADLSVAGDRLTHSQIWLRRAAHHAPDEATRDHTITTFRKVRHANPLSFRLSFAVTPSDNVNNGANSPYNVIEGSPVIGQLSASAQAADGVISTLDLRGAYRVWTDDTHQTRITGRAYLRDVHLSDPVPGLSGDDLSTHRLQLGLSHIWSPSRNGHWRAELDSGRTWYGGDPLYDYLRTGLTRQQRLTDDLRLSLSGAVEWQFDETRTREDAVVWSGLAGVSYAVATDSKLGAQVFYREIDSDGINRASTQWTGVISYDHGRPIGPAKLSVAVGHSVLDYHDYLIISPVPGGRTDRSWFGTLTASLTDLSYMGFVPTVSLRTEKSRSNISRFDVTQTGVSLGVQSEF